MKTWPAFTAELIQEQSALLREKANSIISDRTQSKRNVDMFISGVRCNFTMERSAKMLIHGLDKEHEEMIGLCNKYNKYLLDREAIIKTKLFRKIVRQVDVAKDLFFFESFSDGRSCEVFGDVQSLENSIVSSSMYQLTEEISGYEVPSEFDEKYFAKRIKRIIDEAKNILWKRRSDVGLLYQKRIPIQLLDPPERTKDRIVAWKEYGVSPKIVAHRDSFTVTLPDFCVRSLKECFERKQKKWAKEYNQEIMDKFVSPDNFHPREFDLDRIWNNMFSLLRMLQTTPLQCDPIVYHEDGDWTVVIDQYAQYPKEKEIMRAVKDHYKVLGDTHGIFMSNS